MLQALRIVLACIAQHAARHKRIIEPILSLSIDFYVRMFLRVRTSAGGAKFTASQLSHVWQSTGCDSWWLQAVGTAGVHEGKPPRFQVGRGPAVPERCPISGGYFLMGGPLWNGPLHSKAALAAITSQVQVRHALPSFFVVHGCIPRQRWQPSQSTCRCGPRSPLSLSFTAAMLVLSCVTASRRSTPLTASRVQANAAQHPSHQKLLSLLCAAACCPLSSQAVCRPTRRSTPPTRSCSASFVYRRT